MAQEERDATIALDATDSEEDWHDQLLQLNTDVAMDFVKQNLEISNMESYCNAKEELLNDLKLQVTMLEGEVNLKLQELKHLQEKEDLLTDNLNILNEMINSKEETQDILFENQRLLKSKRERHEKEWKQITANYNSCFKELRENFEKNPLAQKRLHLKIAVQKQRINLAILKQQVQDQKDSNKVLREIRARREQTKIVKFAQIMVDYYEMQKMEQEIHVYEKKLKDVTEKKRAQFTPRGDIFKVPPHKSLPQNKINMKSSFELPPLNLSAYQINPQSFLPNKTTIEGLKSKYCLNKSMDAMLQNMNKRSQNFSPQQQKKLKTGFSLSKSLPYPQNVAKTPATLSLPERVKNKHPPVTVESTSQIVNYEMGNNEAKTTTTTITQDDLFEYTSQENVAVAATTTQPLKSPYFPSASVSVTSEIISSGGMHSRSNKTLEETGEYNEHDLDIMETSSFVSVDFTSPSPPGPVLGSDPGLGIGPNPGPSSAADIQQPNTITTNNNNNDSFFNNIYGGAASSQTKINHNSNTGFSFLNTPSRKMSSQNIFSMF